jgi:hypothetical protein
MTVALLVVDGLALIGTLGGGRLPKTLVSMLCKAGKDLTATLLLNCSRRACLLA